MPSTRPFISFLFGLSSPAAPTSTNQGNNIRRQPQISRPGSAVSSPFNQTNTSRDHNSSSLPTPTPAQSIFGSGFNEMRNSSSSLVGSGSTSPNGEKWWIGGRTSDGNERYYRLQPLTSHKSFDRISLDRLSI